MKNIVLKTTTLSILASSVLLASGWRIPEQSSQSIATSGAYVSSSKGATTSYYNPANMSFNDDKIEAEVDFGYIHLDSIRYTDNRSPVFNGNSKEEDFFIPTMFITSKAYDNFRFGFSLTTPGGLSKQWDDPYEKAYAQEFTLKIVELNPSVSYLVNSNLSVGGGLRVIYSEGIVKSDATTIYNMTGSGGPVVRDMTGETIEYGYNLALAYKPTKLDSMAITYRSNIDLKEDGNAKLYVSGTKVYDGGVDVTVPLPAVLTLSYAHTFNKTTLELTYDKTYWSKYKALDFNYDSSIPVILQSAFDDPKSRNWSDTNAYRIGISHKYNEQLTLMAGFAIDNTPAPEQNVGFELPDSDAKLYSIGADYKLDDKRSIGFGYLLDIKEDRTIKNTDIDGTFTNSKAHLFSFAYRVSF